METSLAERIQQELNSHDVVLYMKGEPIQPRCGFSAAVVQVLDTLKVQFHGVDVLKTPELRQGLKELSNWPTFPQLYLRGELVGGCDIVREMYQSGELVELLDQLKITHAGS